MRAVVGEESEKWRRRTGVKVKRLMRFGVWQESQKKAKQLNINNLIKH